MNRIVGNLVAVGVASALLAACGGAPVVEYSASPKEGDYKFVIPRIVVKVEASQPAADKDAKTGQPAAATKPAALTFTAVPLATGKDKKPLPIFSVQDDGKSAFTLTSTSVTKVTYADNLIIQSIGTTITDNRKAIIDTVFGAIGLLSTAGVFASDGADSCPATLDKFKPVVLEDLEVRGDQTTRLETNKCWGYQVLDASDVAVSATPSPVLAKENTPGLPVGTKVGWFPYPACTYVRLRVVPCDAASGLCNPVAGAQSFQTVIGVSDGTGYQKINLAPKGKVTMQSNFCVADVTSDPSPLSSNWDIANQIITNTKSLLPQPSKK